MSDDRKSQCDVYTAILFILPEALSQLKPTSLKGICPWSWYITRIRHIHHQQILGKVYLCGIGPSTLYPFSLLLLQQEDSSFSS
jgi:hypothetical protein